jgi:hypothetical protein
MRVLLVHPSPLMYTELYLRLEPIGLERVAQALRAAGHAVRLLDLQLFRHADYCRELRDFRPEAVGFSLNYLANAPEVIDLAVATRRRLPTCFVFVGGHSASSIPQELFHHAQGAIDCVIRGEGEAIAPQVLEAVPGGSLEALPGVVTLNGSGPPPALLDSLDTHLPARDLARHRRRYFIGILDPCASIELSRGCPWDCAFCSAWTFYGRSYRQVAPEAAAEDLARIQEPNVFIVDDVAFVHPEHGMAIGQAIERRHIRKQHYLETRCDFIGGGVSGGIGGWYGLTGQAAPLVVEGHVLETAQAILWGLAVAVTLVSAVRQPTRFDRCLALWLATLAGLALLRQLELHRYLTLLFGVRFKTRWLLNSAVPLWSKLLWSGIGVGLAVALVAVPLGLHVTFRALLRRGDAGSGLLAVAVGCLALAYAWDDLLGRGLIIRKLHSQILEETFELLGALAFWASTVVSLRWPWSARVAALRHDSRGRTPSRCHP